MNSQVAIFLQFYTEIAEVPDIRFNQSAFIVNENEGTRTICAVAGQLAEEIIPVRVTISAVSGTAMSKLYVLDLQVIDGMQKVQENMEATLKGKIKRLIWVI